MRLFSTGVVLDLRCDLFLFFAPGCGDSALGALCEILLLAKQAERLYLRGMFLRAMVLLFAVVMFAGCPVPDKNSKKAKGKKEQPQIKDQSGDASFQAFVGRLRKAVENRDKVVMASMMSPDFGYRWDKGPEGETPFSYWDKNKLWGELAALMKERWTPHDAFMVVPPQFAQSETYPGFRAGLTMVNGSWRFAYFVSAPPAGEAQQEAPEEKPLPPLPQ